ncbi:N-acetylglucosamine kinase [Butyrivibrio proteoclasticus]|uniref:N-acetylglucosamine kinase n=1 Tax=Butyrivibrio proteoclasticus TaxID=43305 RepID=UPI000688DF08|nr:BadF/BadG/BcrA/BcrD ATPase family protein [Butyrivibrio proteoclasticus]
MGYYVGIDGGGTGSRFSIAGDDGVVFHTGAGGALNGNGLSIEGLKENLGAVIDECISVAGPVSDCAGLAIGAAGITNAKLKGEISAFLSERGFTDFGIYGDYETAFATAFPEGEGVLLISGTGSMCYGRTRGGLSARSGGYGHLIDDKGSAYDIAVQIMSAIVQAEDGRGEGTCLKDLVFEKLGISDVGELVGFVYAEDTSKGKIAALAQVLSDALEKDDACSISIAENVAKELSALVKAVKTRLNLGDAPVALWGSVLQNNEYIRGLLSKNLGGSTFLPDKDASVGALRLAMKRG